MTRINFTKKFKVITIFLALAMLLMSFAGCKAPDNDDGDLPTPPAQNVVGSQINYVNDVYHEVYIEHGLTDIDKGLVVGLHEDAMEILTSADKIYDGTEEVYLVNDRIKGLTTKTLGSDNNQLKIVKGDKEYTLKYMYVTRAIRNVNDLSINRDQFPSAAWINSNIHPEGYDKYTPYIFEMPVHAGTKIPKLENTGYYVLANDIDIGGTIGGTYNGGQKNVISARHAELKVPTGNYDSDVGFTGTFDGRGHTLKNFTSWQGGMFGYINGGTIKNLAIVGACNYWQGQDKSIFADLSKDAKFENLYILLKQQKNDSGGLEPGQDSDGWGWSRERWAPLFSKGTIHVKNCVLESFILDEEQSKNNNYMQFLSTTAGCTYENVHCIGSSPLAIASYNFDNGVQLMISEKEMEEFKAEFAEFFIDIDYGSIISASNSSLAFDKYYYVMDAIKLLVQNRNPDAIPDDICLVKAPAGVERYSGGLTQDMVIKKFYDAMKANTTAVQTFMDTGCWSYDATTGALTWKNK